MKPENVDITCQQCDFKAKSIPQVVAHTLEAHSKKHVPCDFCEFSCSSREELDAHIESDHDGFIFLNMFAQQQKTMIDNFDLFKQELTGTLNVIINEQNWYKEVLHKVNQSSDVKIRDIEKAVTTLTDEVKKSLLESKDKAKSTKKEKSVRFQIIYS